MTLGWLSLVAIYTGAGVTDAELGEREAMAECKDKDHWSALERARVRVGSVEARVGREDADEDAAWIGGECRRVMFTSQNLPHNSFPSTHSTNSMSIALFLFSFTHRLAYPSNNALNPSHSIIMMIPIEPTLSPQPFMYLTIGLCFYAFSIVFGRFLRFR
jgi:hypothetical protein